MKELLYEAQEQAPSPEGNNNKNSNNYKAPNLISRTKFTSAKVETDLQDITY